MHAFEASLQGLREGELSRRDVVRAGLAAGLSLPAIGALIAGAAPAEAASTATVATGRKPSGTLTFGNPEPPSSAYWDPHGAFGLADQQTWSLVYDMLVTYDEAGKLVPGLATSWHALSPTRTRMKLRPNIKFSDGSPVTVQDVKASLDRIGDPKSKLVFAAAVTPGLHVQIKDAHTFDIVTPKVFGPLMSALPLVAIIPAADAKNPTIFKKRPLGSGPFEFVKYANNAITFKANEGYWRGAPGVAKVVLNYIEDPDARLNALLTGEIDVHPRSSSVDVDAVKGKSTFAVTKSSPASQFIYIPQFNTALGDPRVRQALAYAIDRDSIAKKIIKLDPPAFSSLTATTLGFKKLTPAFEYDPAKAKSMLAAAGQSNLTLTLASANFMAHQSEIDQIVKSSLEAVGITVNLTTLETGTFRSNYNQYALSFNTIGATSRDPDILVAFFQPVIAKSALHMDDATSAKIFDLIQGERQTAGNARLTAVDTLAKYLWENQIMIYIADDVWTTVYSTKTTYRRAPVTAEPQLWKVKKS